MHVCGEVISAFLILSPPCLPIFRPKTPYFSVATIVDPFLSHPLLLLTVIFYPLQDLLKGITSRADLNSENWAAHFANRLKYQWTSTHLRGSPPFAPLKRHEAYDYAALHATDRYSKGVLHEQMNTQTPNGVVRRRLGVSAMQGVDCMYTPCDLAPPYI